MTTEQTSLTAAGPAGGTDLASLAGVDPRTARDLIRVQRDQAAAAERRADLDAAAARTARAAADALQRKTDAQTAKDARKTQRHADQAAAKTARGDSRRARQAATSAWLTARIDYARVNVVSVWCTTVYLLAVGGAVYGQVSAGDKFGWPMLVTFAIAGAVEGTGLSMALTAQELRMRGERATVPRAIAWAATLIASAINVAGHYEPHGALVPPAILGLLSLIGLTVFEIRSGAKHRARLRELGMIRWPRPAIGLDHWWRYPGVSFWAWSACTADPSIRTRDAALAAGPLLRARWQDERARKRLVRLAQLAAKRAARRSGWSEADTGNAVIRLGQLAMFVDQTNVQRVLAANAGRPTGNISPAPSEDGSRDGAEGATKGTRKAVPQDTRRTDPKDTTPVSPRTPRKASPAKTPKASLSVVRDGSQADLVNAARDIAKAHLAINGILPGIRPYKKQLRIGDHKAMEIRDLMNAELGEQGDADSDDDDKEATG